MKSSKKSVDAVSQRSNYASMAMVKLTSADNYLFSILYLFHKEKRMSDFYFIFEAIILLIQCIGLSVQWQNWPLFNVVSYYVKSFFRYLDFSICWNSNTFLLVMFIIVSILLTTAFVLLGFMTFFSKNENFPHTLCSLVILVINLMLTLFYIPFCNVFLGCMNVFIEKWGTNYINMRYDSSSSKIVLLAFSFLFLVAYLFLASIHHLFIFSYNIRSGGFFSTYNGFFSFFFRLLLFLLFLFYSLFSGIDASPKLIVNSDLKLNSTEEFSFDSYNNVLFNFPYYLNNNNNNIDKSFLFNNNINSFTRFNKTYSYNNNNITLSIIYLSLFLLLFLYLLFYSPYYTPFSNSFFSFFCLFCFFFHLFGLFLSLYFPDFSLLNNNNNNANFDNNNISDNITYTSFSLLYSILIWVISISSSFILSFLLSFFVVYKKCKRNWAVRENDAIPQLPGKEKNIDRIFDLLSISSNQKNHIKFKKKESVTAKQKVIESEKESDKEIIKDKEDAKEEENNNVNDNYKSLSLKKKRKKKKENDEGNYFSQYSSGAEKDSSLNREEEDTKRFDLDSNNINNYDNNNSTSLGSYRPNTMKKSKKIDKDKSVLKSPRSLKDVDTTTITDQIDENNQNLTTVLDSYLDCIDILPPPPLPEFPPLMFDENDEFIDKNLNRNNDGINNINNCENCVDLVIAVDMVKTDDGSLELDHEILENNENLRLEEHFQTFTKDSIVEGDGEDINTQTENNNILQSSSPDKFMELELGTETETKKKKIHYNQNYVDSSTVSLDSCQDQSSEKTTYSVQTTNSVQTSNSVDYTNPFQSFLPTIPSFRTSQSLMLIPAVNKKLKKFSSSLDVLHSLSFLCESKMLKSSQYIFFAETLLIYGISKFPTSADLWLFCAIFQIHFFKNLMNFGECLKNVNYSYPNIIQRWEVYFLFQDFERKGSGSYKTSKKFKSSSNPLLGEEEEDDVLSIDDADDDEQQSSLSIHSSMVFKSNISKALNHCTFAKTYLKRVYLMICKDHPDLNRIMKFLDKMVEHEELAHMELKKLLSINPNSVEVLRCLGLLFRDIFGEDDSAHIFFSHADSLEESSSLVNKEDSNNDAKSCASRTSRTSRTTGSNSLSLSTKRRKNNKSKKGSVVAFAESNEIFAALDVFDHPENLISNFYTFMFFSLFILFVCIIVSFVLTVININSSVKIVDTLVSVGEIEVSLSEMLKHMEYFLVNNTRYINSLCVNCISNDVVFIPKVDVLTVKMKDISYIIFNNLKNIYSLTSNTALIELWENLPAEFIYNLGNVSHATSTWKKEINCLSLLQSLSNFGDDMGRGEDITQMFISRFYSCGTSIPAFCIEILKRNAWAYTEYYSSWSNVIMVVDIILGVFSLLFFVIIIIFQFLYYVNLISKKRREAFVSFILTPRRVLLKILDHFENEDNVNDDSVTYTVDSVNDIAFDLNKEDDKEREKIKLDDSKKGKENDGKTMDLEDKNKIMSLIYSKFKFPQPSPEQSQIIKTQFLDFLTANEKIESDPTKFLMYSNMVDEFLQGIFTSSSNKGGKYLDEDYMNFDNRLYSDKLESGIGDDDDNNNNNNEKSNSSNSNEDNTKDHSEKQESNKKIEKDVKNISSFVPISFYIRIFSGIGIVFIFFVAFYVLCVVSLNRCNYYVNSLYLTQYRFVVLNLLGILGLANANSNCGCLYKPNSNFINHDATNPLFNDISHYSGSNIDRRNSISAGITHFMILNKKINSGGLIGEADTLTNDDIIDSTNTYRIIDSSNGLDELMFHSRDCFTCDTNLTISDRLYQMNGKFSGLDGIVQNFLHKSFILSNYSENIIFSTPQLQFMISALNNDIKDGFSIFQDAVYKIHLERARSSNIILISVFVCSLFFAVLSIFICFLPSKNILNNVELNTFRICQIDPSKDKGGKDVVLWNEQFSTDIERFDENHKKVLDYARKMYNVVDDARTTYLSYNANGRDNNDEVKDKNMGFEPFVMSKLIIPAVSRLVVVFFQTLYDEEKLMERYSITRQHIKKHDTQHLALVRKIYDASRHILHSKGNTNVILQIQTLTRTINDWIMSHTLNADRELGALLSGKASKTIMEDVNVDLLNFQVPKSFEVFMMSDEVSMPERESFEKFKKEILVFSKKL